MVILGRTSPNFDYRHTLRGLPQKGALWLFCWSFFSTVCLAQTERDLLDIERGLNIRDSSLLSLPRLVINIDAIRSRQLSLPSVSEHFTVLTDNANPTIVSQGLDRSSFGSMPLSFWREHSGVLITATGLLAIQTALISALLVHRRRARRAHAALETSESRYRHLVESQTDLVCRYLPDSTLTYVNDAYCQFFKMPKEQLVGKKFIEFLPTASRAGALAHISHVASLNNPVKWDHEVLLPNGESRWHHWIDQPIRDDAGRVTELQGTGRDITERKHLEAVQLHLAHALRLAVAGELTAMVAHEVSQPLGAMMANAEAALMLLELEQPPLEEIHQILIDIRDSNLRADQAIRRMRALLRKRELHMEALDMAATIRNTAYLVRGDALRRNVQIHCEFDEQLPAVFGDQIHLQQVLLNLMVNGMDAMEATPVADRKLIIQASTTHQASANEPMVLVSVRDKGTGLAPTLLPQIFASYYSTKKEGMGLGLAISRFIVDAHGGTLWSENNTGGGATFFFSLRLNPTEESVSQEAKRETAIPL